METGGVSLAQSRAGNGLCVLCRPGGCRLLPCPALLRGSPARGRHRPSFPLTLGKSKRHESHPENSSLLTIVLNKMWKHRIWGGDWGALLPEYVSSLKYEILPFELYDEVSVSCPAPSGLRSPLVPPAPSASTTRKDQVATKNSQCKMTGYRVHLFTGIV